MNEDIEGILEMFLFEFPNERTRRDIVSLLRAYMSGQQAASLVGDYNVEDTTYYQGLNNWLSFRRTYQPPRTTDYISLQITMTTDGVRKTNITPRNHIKKHTL